MSCADATVDPHQYLTSFRQFVLNPVEIAIEIVGDEQQEIAIEREAFDEFASRVEDIPGSPRQVPQTGGQILVSESLSETVDLLRAAYEETIMDMPHFDAVYGESIETNLIAEFGPEFASLFERTSDPSFSQAQKHLLLDASRTKVKERERFGDALTSEHDSLQTSYSELDSILDTLDSTCIPAWYADSFDAHVERIIETRQDAINTRPSLSRLDGHDLCAYLYDERPWSYPVLTAVGRLLDIVSVES